VTYVKRHVVTHRCPTPMGSFDPAGQVGDLWRCDDCGVLWRVGLACDFCDHFGDNRSHPGGHAVGSCWRPATLWQRIRYRKLGRT
jgi:hypothetical protein